MTIISCTSC